MKKVNQFGFSPVVTLLSLILVAVVGLAGYYVYNTQQSKKAANNAAKSTPSNSAATSTPPTTQDTQKYLVIKEWGVKIPLSDVIGDATYFYRVFENGDSAVYVSTASITNKYPECAADKVTLYAYSRFNDPKKEDVISGTTLGQLYPNAPKVGDYYYYAIHPQAACFDAGSQAANNKILDTEIQPAMDAFKNAILKVQAQ